MSEFLTTGNNPVGREKNYCEWFKQKYKGKIKSTNNASSFALKFSGFILIVLKFILFKTNKIKM